MIDLCSCYIMPLCSKPRPTVNRRRHCKHRYSGEWEVVWDWEPSSVS